MKEKEAKYIFIRYLILVIIGIPNLYLIYKIFTPLTVYASFFVLSIIYESSIVGNNNLLVNGIDITLIPACIAGAAYYLLIALNLTTPMETPKRVKSLVFILVAFFIFNITRIVAFSILYFNDYRYFYFTHQLIWYIGSTALLIIVWFYNVYIFKIKSTPVYTDMRRLYKDIKR